MGTITRETNTDLFDGAAERTVEVTLLEETYQEILALCRQEKWEEDEGLRIVMARGLAYLQANAEIERLNAEDVDLAAELQKKVQQTADYFGMYSVMKFKAFKLLQVSRTLELNTTGLRGELSLARNTIPVLRQQIEDLKAENAELWQRLAQAGLTTEATPDAENKPAQAKPAWPTPAGGEGEPSDASPANGLWDRLREWVAGTLGRLP